LLYVRRKSRPQFQLHQTTIRRPQTLFVTSRKVARLLLEPLRPVFVPVFHRLQGRFAVQALCGSSRLQSQTVRCSGFSCSSSARKRCDCGTPLIRPLNRLTIPLVWRAFGEVTRTAVNSSARCSFASMRASRRSVFTLSPTFTGMGEGAMTTQSWPGSVSGRCCA